MALSIGSGLIRQTVSWTKFKSIVTIKALAIQYEDIVGNAYGIFAIDGLIVYYSVIFKGTVPAASDTDQTQNDIDKADFETNYKNIVTNKVITPPATYDGYAVATTNPTLIAGSDGSLVRTIRADTSGRLIAVGLGTAGSPAGGLITIQGTSGMTPLSVGGTVNTSAPTWLDSQLRPFSLTLSGRLRVDGSEVTQPVSGTITANAGTGNFTVVQGTASNLRAQTSSESNTGSSPPAQAGLAGGSVTTAAPTYTNGQMSALSLTTAGALRVDSSATTQPVSGTVTANAGTGSFTVVQSTATNLNAQVVPGPGSIGNSWWVRLTDGTNTAAVKASSAPAVNFDPALVVTMSPNSVPTQITQSDTNVTGSLGALNATVSITPSGKYTIGGTITGTWSGTITPEGTIDGTNWFTVRTANKSTNDIINSYTGNDSFEFYSVAGCIGLRLRMSAYTSGTANIVLTGTSLATDAFLNYSGTTADTGPPQRHVSIGTLTNDGTSFHAIYNTNSTPIGDEYALITRGINYAGLNSSFSPDPSSHDTGSPDALYLDNSNNLQVRGQVLTDEGSFRDDFSGSSITTSIGTASWANGSTTVTGTGFQTSIKSGDYVKKTADANSLYVRVSSVDSDTSLTLETAYNGTTASATSVKSNWISTLGASGAIAVSNSNVTITTGTTNGTINSILRRGDYGPLTVRILATVSQRINNQEIRIGVSDNVASLTPNVAAYVSFTGTTNTTVNFVTSSSSAVIDTQTTSVILPFGNTASAHEYKIDITPSQATLSIDGTIVASHNIHIPGPYDALDLMALVANTNTGVTSTTLTIDYFYFANVDRLQIDSEFNNETIPVKLPQAKNTYSVGTGPFTPASTPTDVFCIQGSSTKLIKITRIAFTMNQTTAAVRDVLLIKRSSNNTGGTSTTLTGVSHDSSNVAPTATVRFYTANPTGLGTSVGTLRSRKVFVATLTGNNSNSDEFITEYGTRTDTQPIYLRGTNEWLCINLNGTTSSGNSAACSVEWTEE